jgi:Mu-like prophage major head subunit gpT
VDALLARDYASRTDAITAVVRAHREEVERRAPAHAGHPARVPSAFASPKEEAATSPLQTAIERCLSGEGNTQPLVEILRSQGFEGRTPADVVRAAFTGTRPEGWLRRSFSTSDAKELLLGSGDRRLQERFSEAERGILQITRTRTLNDFREAGILDAGLVGRALKILEGGEITYASVNESAAKYKPCRYGLGLKFSFESMANDDLGGLAAAIDEIRATIPEEEASELVALLSSGSGGNGALAPDGAQLFATAHGNSITGTLGVAGLSEAVQKLRTMKTVGGRTLNLAPGYLLCGPEQETAATQLLSETWAAAQPEDTNPWRDLQLLIEPGIEDLTYYVVAAGPRMPLEIGRVSGMPRMMQTEDFDTSAMKVKVEGAFGVAVADHRVIVRVKAA